jgi:futalosine hydrolase
VISYGSSVDFRKRRIAREEGRQNRGTDQVESRELDFVILTATAIEQQSLRDSVGRLEHTVNAHRQMVYGQMYGKSVVLVETGIGTTNTAQALTAVLEGSSARLVIQLGIGGAFVSGGLEVGDIAVASEEILGEFGVVDETGWSDGETIGIPLLDGPPPIFNRIPLDQSTMGRAVEAAESISEKSGCSARSGSFLTVQNVTGTNEQADLLDKRFGALCENMEGAGAAQVSALYGVPFAEVRGISNRVEKRDLSKWDIPLAASRAQDTVLELIKES